MRLRFGSKTWKRLAMCLLVALGLTMLFEGSEAWANYGDCPEQNQEQMLLAKSSRKHKKKQKKNYSNESGAYEAENIPGLVNLKQIKAPKPGTLRLASWNMHDLFDTVDDPNKDVVLSPREYNDKLNALTTVLRGMHADIVGVQEVEKASCLKDLAKRAGYPYYLLVEGNDTIRGIDVGLLSKVPIKTYATHAQDKCNSSGRTVRFSRDCLEVHFNHPSKLVMLVNHFKSKRGDEDNKSTSVRMAQASRVKSIADTFRNRPLIAVGDLNDEPDSQALSPLVRAKGIHDVLSWIGANRVSFKSKRFNSALDYLLLNDALYAKMVKQSARIVVGKEVKAASDHRPVIVDVTL